MNAQEVNKKEEFLCLESFESERRYCLKGNIYVAEHTQGNVTFIFENGSMNFTPELWGRVKKAWSGVLRKEKTNEIRSNIHANTPGRHHSTDTSNQRQRRV